MVPLHIGVKQIENVFLAAGGMAGKLLKSSGLLVCNLVYASAKGAFTYDVRCFGGIFDLPTYLP